MSAILTLWESLLTKFQTITFSTNSSDELPWLPTDFISFWQNTSKQSPNLDGLDLLSWLQPDNDRAHSYPDRHGFKACLDMTSLPVTKIQVMNNINSVYVFTLLKLYTMSSSQTFLKQRSKVSTNTAKTNQNKSDKSSTSLQRRRWEIYQTLLSPPPFWASTHLQIYQKGMAALQATMAATTTTSAASYKSKLLKVSMWVKSYLE